MRVLVAGAAGQLGVALRQTRPLHADVTGVDRSHIDITDAKSVADVVRATRPQLVVNAAAYTAVDKAECERARAFAVNAEGAAHLARAAHAAGARFIQISTDYVFDGRKSSPYLPTDAPAPLSVYGESKLAGERVAAAATDGAALIVRTAWLYDRGAHNFVTTMLRVLAERDEVRVVADQIGTPTCATGLAEGLWRMAAQPQLRGVHHWTDAGVASWYDFATAIRDAMGSSARARVVPISTSDYPTAARRPPYSVLDKSTTWAVVGTPPHWSAPLRAMLGANAVPA